MAPEKKRVHFVPWVCCVISVENITKGTNEGQGCAIWVDISCFVGEGPVVNKPEYPLAFPNSWGEHWKSTLTFTELNTLLVKIEGVINSRPLTAVSDNNRDTAYYTHSSHHWSIT